MADQVQSCPKLGKSTTEKPRKKRWAPRARTGCISCRRRHIKCDERKPSCNRCLSIGKACESYEAALVSWLSNPAIVLQPNPAQTPFPKIPEAHERQLFYIFRQHVFGVPVVFSSDIWSRASLLACQQYPAAWHAALAIAALYRREQRTREAGNTSSSSDSDGSGMLGFHKWAEEQDDKCALEHCGKAMRFLIQLQREAVTYPEQEMVLITSLMLTSYYRLRRQPAEALVHVKNGITLLRQWDGWRRAAEMPRDACLPNCVAPLASIFISFMRLEMQVFSCVLHVSMPPAPESSGQLLCLRSDPLRSIDDAYEEIIAILTSYRRFYGVGSLPSGLPSVPALDHEHHQWHWRLYDTWRSRFDDFRRAQGIRDDDEFGEANTKDEIDVIKFIIIKVLELVTTLMLSLDFSKGSLAWDDFPRHYERIISHCEEALERLSHVQKQAHVDEPCISMAPMISELLQVVCLVCRDKTIRQRAVTLLKTHPHRSGCLDSLFVAQLVPMMAEVEQSGWRETPIEGGCECRPDTFICRDHRIDLIIPDEKECPTKGHTTLILTTGLDAKRGLPGKRYTVPCFSETGMEGFR